MLRSERDTSICTSNSFLLPQFSQTQGLFLRLRKSHTNSLVEGPNGPLLATKRLASISLLALGGVVISRLIEAAMVWRSEI